jgi:hypothetical protein
MAAIAPHNCTFNTAKEKGEHEANNDAGRGHHWAGGNVLLHPDDGATQSATPS